MLRIKITCGEVPCVTDQEDLYLQIEEWLFASARNSRPNQHLQYEKVEN